jgi:hypothetical protein
MNKMVRMAVYDPGSHLLITHNQNNFQRENPRYNKALAEFLDTIKILHKLSLLCYKGQVMTMPFEETIGYSFTDPINTTSNNQ